jgi:hypothetical protein
MSLGDGHELLALLRFGYHLLASSPSTHLPFDPDVDSILHIWNDTKKI